MKLVYKGSAHRISGPGMDFANWDNGIPCEESIGKEFYVGVGDTFIRIYKVEGDVLHFAVRFYDKVTPYTIRRGETITHKQEGNAFGFELHFEIID